MWLSACNDVLAPEVPGKFCLCPTLQRCTPVASLLGSLCPVAVVAIHVRQTTASVPRYPHGLRGPRNQVSQSGYTA